MKLVHIGFLLALSASFIVAADLDLQADDEAAVGPALTRVRRSGSSESSDDDDDDDEEDDEECCQNSCDEDYFYEMVLKFEDKNAKKNLDLGRVVVNEKDCEGANDKSDSESDSESDSKSDSDDDCSRSHHCSRCSKSRSDSDSSD